MGSQAYAPPDFESSGSGAYNVSGSMASAGPGNPLLGSGNKTGSIFSFDFYQWYFNVDTPVVLYRCLLALNPFNNTPFIDSEADLNVGSPAGLIAGGDGNPDLYGPFWLCTTVIFVLFFASTLTGLLFTAWQGGKYDYKFDLLTGAAGLMYGYTFVIPTGLWLIVRYLNISPSTTLLQLISLYGYSNVTWIPVAILSISPLLGTPTLSNVIRWIMIALGFTLSGSFIGKNVYRALIPSQQSDSFVIDRKPALSVLIGVIALHMGLSFAVKILFFGTVTAPPPPTN
ncbi:Yip5p [Sugiyamaella lignohabitans]|uniref:Protein YIP n=1 Tax=Sugiyamaella lignohabitans TaxID=796027 RepID=A0A161HLW9_9ASCO|nr:Yip5p [Sugiyamaella lignohabitans]ANB14497.1 Yip5p [Sugiyamaella lignohabitans]